MFSLAEIPQELKSKSIQDFCWDWLGSAGGDLRTVWLDYVAGSGEGPLGIYLSGPAGVGKTHLLVAAYKELALCHHHGPGGVSLAFWRGLCAQYRTLVASGIGWDSACNLLASAAWLLLDDIGFDTAFEQKVFRTIVELAFDSGTALFVTTNLEPVDLASRFDFHASSRLNVLCRFASISGPDRRDQSETSSG